MAEGKKGKIIIIIVKHPEKFRKKSEFPLFSLPSFHRVFTLPIFTTYFPLLHALISRTV
jgi:hypothetical protein